MIGYSGHTGCTTGTNHLHFGVFRLTNTELAVILAIAIEPRESPGAVVPPPPPPFL